MPELTDEQKVAAFDRLHGAVWQVVEDGSGDIENDPTYRKCQAALSACEPKVPTLPVMDASRALVMEILEEADGELVCHWCGRLRAGTCINALAGCNPGGWGSCLKSAGSLYRFGAETLR